jgi:gamma-glutamyl hercynylcysteine S-oxide synthase
MSAMPFPSDDPRAVIAGLMAEARERTLLLVEGLSDEELHRQHDPLMSPILWDLGHIAHFEELWLTQNLDGPIEFSEMPGMYNPFEHPRSTRAALPLPAIDLMRQRLAEIRERVLERLNRTDFDERNPLLAGGYVYHMVLQHEYQHNETILQTLQLKAGEPYHPVERWAVPQVLADNASAGGMVEVPAGEYTVGTTDRSVAYDNERPLHAVSVEAFRIDRSPVTNGDYLQFMRDGGYEDVRHWTPDGLKWLADTRHTAPKHWTREGDGWVVRSMDSVEPLDHRRPVCHVSWHEASAFASWAGKRLPTETEWEIAASWNSRRGLLKFPWGDDDVTRRDANVDQLSFGTAPVGAYPRNVSPLGCYGMIGDVWEWTSSDFTGYPGFESFPYREYSEAFFGSEYKVLRGGSWATRPGSIRNTFRNWDYPIRRQIFSGFRCASDARAD